MGTSVDSPKPQLVKLVSYLRWFPRSHPILCRSQPGSTVETTIVNRFGGVNEEVDGSALHAATGGRGCGTKQHVSCGRRRGHGQASNHPRHVPPKNRPAHSVA